jgi:hypothetical protein
MTHLAIFKELKRRHDINAAALGQFVLGVNIDFCKPKILSVGLTAECNDTNKFVTSELDETRGIRKPHAPQSVVQRRHLATRPYNTSVFVVVTASQE